MRVVVTIQHPAHVHLFRHAIRELEARDHEVFVFAREKEVAVALLDAYGVDHEVLAGPPTPLPPLPGSGSSASDSTAPPPGTAAPLASLVAPESRLRSLADSASSLASLAAVQATYETRLLRRARRIEPDVVTAVGGVAASHVARLVGARSVVFYDTEHAALIKRLAYPFADVVCTPDCYRGDAGPRQCRYPGYHELAYLHPDRFTPDPDVLDDLDLAPEDPYVVVRLVDWGASHDVGQGGFDDARDAVDRLRATGARVLVSSEASLPRDLDDHRVQVAPHRMHDLLAYADCFVGEGATMAAESAVLGTPACYVNTLSLGYIDELATRYGLLRRFQGPARHRRALDAAVETLADPDRATWAARREAMLAEKTDTTDVVVEQLRAAGRAAAREAVA